MVLKCYLFMGLLLFAACKPGTKSCESCDETNAETGQSLYLNQCVSCHGEKGDLGNSGAEDLSKSKLTDQEISYILSEGQGAMPPMLELVEEPKYMDSIVEYVKTLRTE